ncbi:rRNA N6-adenosine-methyltransferase METTL5 [Hydra vulgaris]|uniref:Methyltransferase-like protein 5 n=1 Tax=Hydra vulgaris TaxID=6087 RepID=A0ABM4CHN5_HYDVU
MRLKQLEGYLQQCDGFLSPKINLEQYATSAHIASHMTYTMDQTFDDIRNKLVADFGCGCGMLSAGCGMLKASHLLGIDIDNDALDIAAKNMNEFELQTDFLNYDLVNNIEMINYLAQRKIIDVVVMNPPFGTKNNQGIDLKFLRHAVKVSQSAVYSLHKTSTRDFIVKRAEEFGCEVEILAELKYDLPKTYKFHRKQSLDISVDFIRCQPRT